MQVISVNVARADMREIGGRHVATAIGKKPVFGRVAVQPLGLAGDALPPCFASRTLSLPAPLDDLELQVSCSREPATGAVKAERSQVSAS